MLSNSNPRASRKTEPVSGRPHKIMRRRGFYWSPVWGYVVLLLKTAYFSPRDAIGSWCELGCEVFPWHDRFT